MRLTDHYAIRPTRFGMARTCSRMRLTPSVQHPSCHTEVFGSLSLVSTGTLKHFVDDAVFKISQRFAQAKRQVDLSGVGLICRGGGWMGWISDWLGVRVLDIRREMLRFKDFTWAKEDCPFYQVA